MAGQLSPLIVRSQDRLTQPKLPHLAAEIEARAFRQAHIQDEQVGVMLAGIVDALTTGAFQSTV